MAPAHATSDITNPGLDFLAAVLRDTQAAGNLPLSVRQHEIRTQPPT